MIFFSNKEMSQHFQATDTEKYGSRGTVRGIMYHSRMRYLASREGNRQITLRERGSGIVGDKSTSMQPKISLLGASHIPCSQERLVPPTELMTRERSFRHTYWKYHKPKISFRNTDFLKKKENPIVKKKRDEIFARIKAAEIASERSIKEKESWKRSEIIKKNNTITILNSDSNPLNSLSGENSDQSESGIAEINRGLKTDDIAESIDSGTDSSSFQHEGKNNTRLFTGKQNNVKEDYTLSGEDTYPEGFSFISDWRKDRCFSWTDRLKDYPVT